MSARTQKDAAGNAVRTDTPAFGCQTVEHAPKPAADTKPTTTKKSATADKDSGDGTEAGDS